MRVPLLTRRLILEGPVQVADGAGGFERGWGVLGTLWAEVVPGAGRETAGEEVVLAAVAYRITVRGAPAGATSRPVPGQRFRDGARVFQIVAVTEFDPGGRFMTCFCREEVAP